jgi:CRISPR-associated endonuclease/helicase Cas3
VADRNESNIAEALSPDEVSALFSRYWGKADPAAVTAGPNHHTVLGHSLDVAACAFVLVDQHPTLRAQLSRSSGIAEEVVALSFASVCAIHDVGKLDTRFQRKAAVVADVIRPESSDTPRGHYDHGTEGFRQIEDDEAVSGAVKERLGPGAMPLLRAVCGHHGILPSTDEPDPSRSTIRPSLRREDAKARRIFVDLVLDFFAAHGATLPWPDGVDSSQVQLLAGLCAIADWIGSNVDYFPYKTVPRNLGVYWEEACSRAQIACGESGLLRSTAAVRGFGDLFPGYTPRDVQVLTESVKVHAPALIIVEAEMGKGKTEAALSIAARYLGDGGVDGITIALPTMATSNAMFARVEKLMTHLFPGTEVQLALAHGRARRQPRFQKLIEHRLRARDLDAAEA